MLISGVLGKVRNIALHLWLFITSVEYRLIKKSAIFDYDYYLSHNPDLAEPDMDLFLHFVRRGGAELRKASVFFDPDYYLSQFSSVQRIATNPLVHFMQEGWRQGKKPNPLFHTGYYMNRYADLLTVKENPLTFYLKKGWILEHCTSPEVEYLTENVSVSALIKRKINPLTYFLQRKAYYCFDSQKYSDQIPGLTRFTDDCWGHYMKYGAAEGKSPVLLFDPLFYRQNNSDIPSACLDLYTHYQGKKRYEQVRPSKWFDPVFYMEQVSEQEMAGLTPLEHYLETGVYEGRYTDRRVASLPVKPLISVVVPVYNVNSHYLNNCIRSLLYQAYPHWELCLADDCSTDPHVRPLLREWATKDERIRVVYLKENEGISGATRQAINLAGGKYLAFLDNDDELTIDALYYVAKSLYQTGAELVYTDEDLIGDDGRTFSTFYKPDFNPELLLCHNYVTHLLVCSKNLYGRSGGFLTETDGAQDYDLVLKLSLMATRIYHIARVLYHWRASDTSTSINHQQKKYADLAGKLVVEKALERMGRAGDVLQTEWKFYYQPRFKISGMPLVSVISTWHTDIGKTVTWAENLCSRTTYTNFELFIVIRDDKKLYSELVEKLKKIDTRIRVIHTTNSGAQKSYCEDTLRCTAGEYVAFIDPGLEIRTPGWIEALLQFAQFEETGFVGGRIAPGEGQDEVVSTVPDIDNYSADYYLQWLAGCSQHMNGLQCSQEVMMVTGQLCLARRSYLEECECFKQGSFCTFFEFADISLEFRRRNLRNIYAAASVVQYSSNGSPVRGGMGKTTPQSTRERILFQKKWQQVLESGDPFYNSGCYLEKNISIQDFNRWYLGS